MLKLADRVRDLAKSARGKLALALTGTLHTVEGLWRRSTRARPGSMTAFIRDEHLLPADEIDRIIRDAPLDLIRFQDVAAVIPLGERPTMGDWLDRFHAAFPERGRGRSDALAA